MQKVVTIRSLHAQISGIILKPNKSHTIVPYKSFRVRPPLDDFFIDNRGIVEKNLTNLYIFGKLSKNTFKNFYF